MFFFVLNLLSYLSKYPPPVIKIDQRSTIFGKTFAMQAISFFNLIRVFNALAYINVEKGVKFHIWTYFTTHFTFIMLRF